MLRFVLVFLLLSAGVEARTSFAPGIVVPNNNPFVTPEARIAAGQSHRGIYLSGVNEHGLNPQTQTVLTPGILVSSGFPSGLFPIVARPTQSLNNQIAGMTSAMQFLYPPPASDTDSGNGLDISRSAALSLNLLRLRAGVTRVIPQIVYNMAIGGSSWIFGHGGGLGSPTATFTGTIVAGSPPILTVASITATPNSPANPPGSGTLVAAVIESEEIIGAGVGAATLHPSIDTFGTAGTTGTGGNGTYAIADSPTQGSVGPEAMLVQSQAWRPMQLNRASVAAALPSTALRLNAPCYKSYDYTDAGSFNRATTAPTVQEFTAMTVAVDAENFSCAGTTGMLYYIAVQSPPSTDTTAETNTMGTVEFARLNANGRTIATNPIYQWVLQGDSVHTADFGILRWGEEEALAKHITEDEGTPFTPLWLSKTRSAVVAGNTIRVPFDRPAGTEYAAGVMSWMTDPQEGIMARIQMGFHVFRAGVEVPLCNGTPTISALDVILDICTPVLSGDEYSYAYHGTLGNPLYYGIGGNLAMAGPPTVLLTGLTPPLDTINQWAWPFVATVP